MSLYFDWLLPASLLFVGSAWLVSYSRLHSGTSHRLRLVPLLQWPLALWLGFWSIQPDSLPPAVGPHNRLTPRPGSMELGNNDSHH